MRVAAMSVTLLVAVAVGAWLLWKPAAERRSYEFCRLCATDRVTTEIWRGGVSAGESTQVDPSPVFVELLDQTHKHVWVFSSSDAHDSDGSITHADGFPDLSQRPNRFVFCYSENEKFRTFVQAKIAAGELTREDASRIVEMTNDAIDGDSPAAARVRALFDGFPGTLR